MEAEVIQVESPAAPPFELPSRNDIDSEPALTALIAAMHADMPSEFHGEYVQALRRLKLDLDECGISRALSWSVWQSTGLGTHCMRQLCSFWNRMYELDLVLDVDLYVDSRSASVRHISQQFEPPFHLEQSHELANDFAVNAATNKEEMLPYVWKLDATLPFPTCKPGARNTEKGAGQFGWNVLEPIVTKHWPPLILVDGSAVAFSKGKCDTMPALEFIASRLRSHGYWCFVDVADASSYGGPCPYERFCIAACLGLNGGSDPNEITHFFNRALTAFKLESRFRVDWDEIVTLDADPHDQTAFEHQMSLVRNVPVGKQGILDGDWKLDHKLLFSNQGFPWPYDAISTPSYIDGSGLSPRQRESVQFLDLVFPPRSDTMERRMGRRVAADKQIMEFLDIGPSLRSVVATYLEGCWGAAKPDTTPWSSHVRSLSSTSVIIVRYSKDGKYFVRAWDSFEYMRFIGWHDSLWKTQADGQVLRHTQGRLCDFSDIICNSLTMFHYVPWTMAL